MYSEAHNGREICIRHRKKVIATRTPPLAVPKDKANDAKLKAELRELAAKELLKLPQQELERFVFEITETSNPLSGGRRPSHGHRPLLNDSAFRTPICKPL
ncbi:MAG: hypothetical protein HY231_16305 [Acidobacteria bacterium]|nr:hypothetical protein [Acidobacteriota bacterium]